MIGGSTGIAGHLMIGNNVRVAGHTGVGSNIKDGETIQAVSYTHLRAHET